MFQRLILSILPLVFVSQAQALVQLRAGYGVQTPADTSYTVGTLSSMGGFNLDALVDLPMMPVGLGLRYESMGFDTSVSGVATSSSMERTSLLVNYRIIDLFLYLGAIGSVGVANSAQIEIPGSQINYDSTLTYSIGAEGGVSLGLIKLGAELGYLMANFESKTAGVADLDLSGVYAKAIVGVGF